MTSPIVERLRRLADEMARFLGPPEMAPCPDPDDLTEAVAEIERLSAELARAREVLRPFAKENDISPYTPDVVWLSISVGEMFVAHCTVGDLRAARQFIEKEPQG